MKIKPLLLYYFILISVFGYSQDNKIDSLEALLQSEIHDTIRLEVYQQLINEIKSSNLEASTAYCHQMIDLSQKKGYPDYTLMGYKSLIGFMYFDNSTLDTVIYYYEKALPLIEIVQDIGLKSSFFSNVALNYSKFGKNEEAYSFHTKAVRLAKESGDHLKISEALNNLGNFLQRRDEFDQAKTYYLEALQYAKQANNLPYIARYTSNVGVAYYNENKLDSALVLFEESLEMKRKIGSETSIMHTLVNIGQILIDLKKYELSKRYLDEAYQISTRLNFTSGTIYALTGLSHNAYVQKKYDLAISYAKECLDILEGTGDIKMEVNLYETLSNIYTESGKFDLAVESLTKFHILKDSLYQKDRMEQIRELEVAYEVKQKEVENKLLKSEQINIEKTLRNRTNMAVGLIIAFILALGWAVAAYRSSQQKKKINAYLEKEVRKRTEDLEVMNKDLKQANYELKTFNYIASHDIKEPIKNIGNFVGLIHRQLPEDQKTKLSDYFKIIKRGTTQLYTLLEDFAKYTSLSHNGVIELEQVDFNTVIESVASNLQTMIQEKNGLIQNAGLPTIASNSSLAFVALKNLIENGLKFNESKIPTINLSYKEHADSHEVSVVDNGIGIEAQYFDKIFIMFKRLHHREQYRGSGIGLAIAKLAMDKLGGEIALESIPGEGSQFILKFPK